MKRLKAKNRANRCGPKVYTVAAVFFSFYFYAEVLSIGKFHAPIYHNLPRDSNMLYFLNHTPPVVHIMHGYSEPPIIHRNHTIPYSYRYHFVYPAFPLPRLTITYRFAATTTKHIVAPTAVATHPLL